MRQLKLLDAAVKPRQLPNLERAAEFLQDLPRLWLHPGVTHEEREALVKQVFQRITIDGKDFVDIEPKPEYAPLFATKVTGQKVGYRETDSTLYILGSTKREHQGDPGVSAHRWTDLRIPLRIQPAHRE